MKKYTDLRIYLRRLVRSQKTTEAVEVSAIEEKGSSLVFKGVNSMGHFTEVSAELDEPLIVDGRIYGKGAWPHQATGKGSLTS